ncbi:hypothetical protein P43SY_003628 [Pythium insidiosum]|uniref:YbaK/aminoacyl-tRNA synthetase-associated domain-containing protein n=1 Tax=Pythium insidiosum TaxID=114742 RepID=A0AAD5QD15_PYTIN|nr:hypothetical protein P43SY_003628 [Pythium insidiosum]
MAAATTESVQAKLAEAQRRLALIERSVDERESVGRVRQHLQRAKLSSATLKTAPSDYYSWTLSQRGEFLQCSVPHLCKSIIVENTACTNAGMEDPLNSRYYCVIVQYNSKLNAEQLMRFVRSRIPEDVRPGRKAFNFQHADGKTAEELTGFKFNGVSPFGMKVAIPVIISGAVAALNPPFIWLGGGAESVKLRISVHELQASLHAVVAPDITSIRDDL